MKVILTIPFRGEDEKIDLSLLPPGALPRVGETVILGLGAFEVTSVVWDLIDKKIDLRGVPTSTAPRSFFERAKVWQKEDRETFPDTTVTTKLICLGPEKWLLRIDSGPDCMWSLHIRKDLLSLHKHLGEELGV